MMLKRLLLTLTLLLPAATAHAEELRLVEVLSSPERTETLKRLVAGFEARHPGTHVEITSLAWGSAFEKLATMVAAGDIPDVVEMPDRWLSLYAGNGQLESLEPYLARWPETQGLNDRALTVARSVADTAYMLPYGFYLRALYYNKAVFRQAGIAEPPRTLEELRADAARIAQLPGKSGYCLRGGPGGLNGWVMFGASIAGGNAFFHDDGTSTLNDAGWVAGTTWLIDLYKDGLAPRDSVNWGFNEVVAGFYTGTCAMVDQDPDALIALKARMKAEDFGVAPWPKGPNGKAYPTLGFAGWSIFKKSAQKDLAWDLVAALNDPAGNLAWNQQTGALPVYTAAAHDPLYAGAIYQGWFAELADPDVVPTLMPTYLPGFAYFADSLVVRSSQQALLGQISPATMNKQWAAYLTKAKRKQASSSQLGGVKP
ncbi:carbohydrate ABC transporter substrate-binding protein (CUT1 family) [Nitrospirillum amazonense]|uniref:Carbohydrate ABC transporter substrate-binding protein (CUT1 family) n=1 Tax=Nitrospirillum amazonense TaxID=28077 RepID=A0A560KB73_9PROT|nr:sugar ABC transporter substrate-binding protein [Nitrospirillum amazonense]TWB80259.1 carbohydrate ABC transporter substrate-binding protein (CUT1 family) [Nitrospirillum amazonense]